MPDFAERVRRLPADIVAALSFFSRIPVRTPPEIFDLREVSGAWPAAGLLIAVAPAAVVVVGSWFHIPIAVVAFLALAAAVAATGALHEDGLTDAFDGLGGSGGRRGRLATMRDSRLGTFGALALMLAILVRGLTLAAIAHHPGRAVLALLGVAVVSRAAALWHWSGTAPARRDGMAFAAGQPDTVALQIGLLSGLIAAIVLLVAFHFAALFGLVLAALGVALFSPLCNRRFGGHTGDTIGAAQQIAETLLFVGLSAGAATLVV